MKNVDDVRVLARTCNCLLAHFDLKGITHNRSFIISILFYATALPRYSFCFVAVLSMHYFLAMM